MPRKLLRRYLPHPRQIREQRFLAWLRPWLVHERVWHISREGIAIGAAIGVFFGLLVPLAQIPIAAAAAILLRANLPMAVVGTFVSNPFTFAPLYYLAYRIGLLLSGVDVAPTVTPEAFDSDAEGIAAWLGPWSERLLRFGKPLFIGLFVLATSAAAIVYLSIHWFWRARTLRAWRERMEARRAARKLRSKEHHKEHEDGKSP